jgi:hypothetical protein
MQDVARLAAGDAERRHKLYKRSTINVTEFC